MTTRRISSASGSAPEKLNGATVQPAGTDRLITGISYMIHNSFGFAFDADVIGRLYAGGDSGGEPGALLWESAAIRMTILRGPNLYDFAVPNVVVPDEVTWTVQLPNSSKQGERTGLRFMDPPTVGSSEDNVWEHADGVWTGHSFGIGAPNNLGAIITTGVRCDDPCDMNCDGIVNAFDIGPFIALLFGPGKPCAPCTGDVNGDGVIDAFDIEPFLECLFP